MALDIRGSRKNTKINKNIHVFVDELISNSIDSYLIRKNREPSLPGLIIDLTITFHDYKTQLFEGSKTDIEVTCTDNGDGFADQQVKAFITKDTTYKDDLSIAGIDQCKGSGRIQFLHYFRHISIDSVFLDGNTNSKRSLHIDADHDREISQESFKQTPADASSPISTSITLKDIRQDVYEKLFKGKDLCRLFSTEYIEHYIMINFLHRLVSLREQLGEFCIKITSKDTVGTCSSTQLNAAALPVACNKRIVNVPYLSEDGSAAESSEEFTISHYKLKKAEFALNKNLVALCAKSSIVKSITGRYLRPTSAEYNDIHGFYHIVLIESDYLNRHVNISRDDFDIPANSRQEELFAVDSISYEQIYSHLDDVVEELLAPPDWSRDQVVRAVGNKYGISAQMISDADVRVRFGDTEERLVHRVLASYQKRIITDTGSIVNAQLELKKCDPLSAAFREKLNDIAWKYTSSLKSIDMSNLSQLVVRRSALLEILKLAIHNDLPIQKDAGQGNDTVNKKSEKRCDERIVHSLFFPMGKDSKETVDHDIWILSDEYHYFDYIASDKSLSTYRWDESSALFEEDIDSELEKAMRKNYVENTLKRPDIAIFGKGGAVVVIEFKAPGVKLDAHTNDLMEYAQLLIAKSKGRLKKVYGYLLGDNLDELRLRGYQKFASGRGWFGTENIREPTTGRVVGELYSEILYYDDLVDRAEQRLAAFRKRLNFSFV